MSALPETYRDCLAFLYGRNQFAVKLGLDNINALLDRLGRPDAGLAMLHVAGTNGKGSVCANLAAMLGASGFPRVGLYTSPHLVSFRERILVDGEPIPKEWIVGWMRGAMGDILDLGVTYFEIVTAMALDHFKARGCEAVVLETGLGGRLDATNAVKPAVTVITSISLDHTAILGDTVEAIWREKAAILKPGTPMVVREDRPHLLAELMAAAAPLASPVTTLRDFPWTEEPQGRLRFRLRGGERAFPADLRPEAHQRENLALSLLALEAFLARTGKAVPPSEALEPALRGAKVPGRTQALSAPGRADLVLDGAHNAGGMEALAAWIRKAYPGRPVTALFSVMKDKDVASVYRTVAGFAGRVLFVPLTGRFPRALELAELEALLAGEEGNLEGTRPRPRPEAFPLDAGALDRLLARPPGEAPGSGPLFVACGSLYFLGALIPLLARWYPGLAWFRRFEGEE